MLNMYDEDITKLKLDNGLTLLLIHKADYVKSHALFVTPFGAQNIIMDDADGKTYEFKKGLAHFLEHKMFESKDGDVSMEFSKMGISANAFTSYTETAYFFSTSFDIEKPLNLLLDFVQELYISEESVEKEKGIITQELSMYLDMPDSRFVFELFASLFSKNPLRYDVGGDKESVNATTLADLQQCYALTYHPSNMLLVIVSGEDNQKLIKIVEENQKKKTFPKIDILKKHVYNEPTEVARPSYEFKMDVNIPRYGLAFKLTPICDSKKRYLYDLCLKMALEAYLSSANEYVQTWLDERLINDSFVYDCDISDDYAYIALYSETNKANEFKQAIISTLDKMKNTPFTEEMLIPIKRRLIGSQIRLLNSFEDYAIVYARMLFNGLDFFDCLELLKSISVDDVNNVIKQLNLDNYCELNLKS